MRVPTWHTSSETAGAIRLFYKIFALIMLFVGGLQAYTVVWDLGDVGIGLMTVFNLMVLFPLSGEALRALREYEEKKKMK